MDTEKVEVSKTVKEEIQRWRPTLPGESSTTQTDLPVKSIPPSDRQAYQSDPDQAMVSTIPSVVSTMKIVRLCHQEQDLNIASGYKPSLKFPAKCFMPSELLQCFATTPNQFCCYIWSTNFVYWNERDIVLKTTYVYLTWKHRPPTSNRQATDCRLGIPNFKCYMSVKSPKPTPITTMGAMESNSDILNYHVTFSIITQDLARWGSNYLAITRKTMPMIELQSTDGATYACTADSNDDDANLIHLTIQCQDFNLRKIGLRLRTTDPSHILTTKHDALASRRRMDKSKRLLFGRQLRRQDSPRNKPVQRHVRMIVASDCQTNGRPMLFTTIVDIDHWHNVTDWSNVQMTPATVPTIDTAYEVSRHADWPTDGLDHAVMLIGVFGDSAEVKIDDNHAPWKPEKTNLTSIYQQPVNVLEKTRSSQQQEDMLAVKNFGIVLRQECQSQDCCRQHPTNDLPVSHLTKVSRSQVDRVDWPMQQAHDACSTQTIRSLWNVDPSSDAKTKKPFLIRTLLLMTFLRLTLLLILWTMDDHGLHCLEGTQPTQRYAIKPDLPRSPTDTSENKSSGGSKDQVRINSTMTSKSQFGWNRTRTKACVVQLAVDRMSHTRIQKSSKETLKRDIWLVVRRIRNTTVDASPTNKRQKAQGDKATYLLEP